MSQVGVVHPPPHPHPKTLESPPPNKDAAERGWRLYPRVPAWFEIAPNNSEKFAVIKPKRNNNTELIKWQADNPREGYLKMRRRECESVWMNEFKIQWVALLQSSIHGPACGLIRTAERLPRKVEALMQQTRELCLTVHIHLD